MKVIRTEIIRFEEGGPVWSIETVRLENKSIIEFTELSDDWTPGGGTAWASFQIPFEQARAIAVGLLRAVYHEMPSTWYLADGDPQEYLSHILEIIYDMTPKRKAHARDGIHNLLAIESHIRRLTRLLGKARRKSAFLFKRYEHAAGWARRNHKKIIEQRKQLAALNERKASDGEIQKEAHSS